MSLVQIPAGQLAPMSQQTSDLQAASALLAAQPHRKRQNETSLAIVEAIDRLRRVLQDEDGAAQVVARNSRERSRRRRASVIDGLHPEGQLGVIGGLEQPLEAAQGETPASFWRQPDHWNQLAASPADGDPLGSQQQQLKLQQQRARLLQQAQRDAYENYHQRLFGRPNKNLKPVHVSISSQTVNGLLSLLMLFVIAVYGSIGAILIMSALTVIESLQTRGNCYLVSLAMAHLIVTLLVVPSSALQIMAGDSIDVKQLCHYQWLTLEFAFIVSQLSFMLIAADNYLGYKCSEKVVARVTPEKWGHSGNRNQHCTDERRERRQAQGGEKPQAADGDRWRRSHWATESTDQTAAAHNLRDEFLAQSVAANASSSSMRAVGAAPTSSSGRLRFPNLIRTFLSGCSLRRRRRLTAKSIFVARFISCLSGNCNEGVEHQAGQTTKPSESDEAKKPDGDRPMRKPDERQADDRAQFARQFAHETNSQLMRPGGVFNYRNCCGRLKVLLWILSIWLLAFVYVRHKHELSYGPRFCSSAPGGNANGFLQQPPQRIEFPESKQHNSGGAVLKPLELHGQRQSFSLPAASSAASLPQHSSGQQQRQQRQHRDAGNNQVEPFDLVARVQRHNSHKAFALPTTLASVHDGAPARRWHPAQMDPLASGRDAPGTLLSVRSSQKQRPTEAHRFANVLEVGSGRRHMEQQADNANGLRRGLQTTGLDSAQFQVRAQTGAAFELAGHNSHVPLATSTSGNKHSREDNVGEQTARLPDTETGTKSEAKTKTRGFGAGGWLQLGPRGKMQTRIGLSHLGLPLLRSRSLGPATTTTTKLAPGRDESSRYAAGPIYANESNNSHDHDEISASSRPVWREREFVPYFWSPVSPGPNDSDGPSSRLEQHLNLAGEQAPRTRSSSSLSEQRDGAGRLFAAAKLIARSNRKRAQKDSKLNEMSNEMLAESYNDEAARASVAVARSPPPSTSCDSCHRNRSEQSAVSSSQPPASQRAQHYQTARRRSSAASSNTIRGLDGNLNDDEQSRAVAEHLDQASRWALWHDKQTVGKQFQLMAALEVASETQALKSPERNSNGLNENENYNEFGPSTLSMAGEKLASKLMNIIDTNHGENRPEGRFRQLLARFVRSPDELNLRQQSTNSTTNNEQNLSLEAFIRRQLSWTWLVGLLAPSLISSLFFFRAYIKMREVKMRPYKPMPAASLALMPPTLLAPRSPIPLIAQRQVYAFDLSPQIAKLEGAGRNVAPNRLEAAKLFGLNQTSNHWLGDQDNERQLTKNSNCANRPSGDDDGEQEQELERSLAGESGTSGSEEDAGESLARAAHETVRRVSEITGELPSNPNGRSSLRAKRAGGSANVSARGTLTRGHAGLNQALSAPPVPCPAARNQLAGTNNQLTKSYRRFDPPAPLAIRRRRNDSAGRHCPLTMNPSTDHLIRDSPEPAAKYFAHDTFGPPSGPAATAFASFSAPSSALLLQTENPHQAQPKSAQLDGRFETAPGYELSAPPFKPDNARFPRHRHSSPLEVAPLPTNNFTDYHFERHQSHAQSFHYGQGSSLNQQHQQQQRLLLQSAQQIRVGSQRMGHSSDRQQHQISGFNQSNFRPHSNLSDRHVEQVASSTEQNARAPPPKASISLALANVIRSVDDDAFELDHEPGAKNGLDQGVHAGSSLQIDTKTRKVDLRRTPPEPLAIQLKDSPKREGVPQAPASNQFNDRHHLEESQRHLGDEKRDTKVILCTYSYMTDEQLLKSNIVVFVVHSSFWLPFVVLQIVIQYREASGAGSEYRDLVWWFATLNCCSCSYLYALSNKDFREAFNKLIYYLCCKSHVTYARKTPVFRRQLDVDQRGNLRVHIIPGLNVYSSKLFASGLRNGGLGSHLDATFVGAVVQQRPPNNNNNNKPATSNRLG